MRWGNRIRLIFERDVYLFDNYNLALSRDFSLPGQQELMSIVGLNEYQFLVLLDQPLKMLSFIKIMKGDYMEKHLQIELQGKVVFINDKILVVEHSHLLRVYLLKNIIAKLQLDHYSLHIPSRVRFLTANFDRYLLRLVLWRGDLGLIQLSIELEKTDPPKTQDEWLQWMKRNGKWLVLSMFLMAFVIVSSIKSFEFAQQKKEFKDKKSKLKDFLDKHKSQITDINKKIELKNQIEELIRNKKPPN